MKIKPTISMTKISDYLNCPFSYFLKYIGEKPSAKKSLAMWCGFVAEKSVSLYMEAPSIARMPNKLARQAFHACYDLLPFVSEEFKNAYFDFVDSYPRQSLSQTVILNNLANGLSTNDFAYKVSSKSASKGDDLFTSHLLKLFRNIHAFHKNDSWIKFVDQLHWFKVQQVLNAELEHFIGTGVADLIVQTDINEILILDIKYSKYNFFYNLNSDYQLAFYKMLYEKTYPDKTVIVGHLNLYVPEKEVFHFMTQATPDLEKDIDNVLDKIHNDTANSTFLKVCGVGAYNGIQKRCGVKTACPSATKGF
jgi:hypothetical protein